MSCCMCRIEKDESELIETKCKKFVCLTCISKYVKENLSSKIKCPIEDCEHFLRDKIIREVLSDADIEKYEDICLGKIICSHTCLLKECGKKIVYTDYNTTYDCPNCSLFNCISCKFPHYFKSCDDFKSMEITAQNKLETIQYSRARNKLFEKNKKIVQESIESNNEIDLWPSKEIFTCTFCGNDIPKYAGVCLRTCLDLLCRECLKGQVKTSNKIPVLCPVCSKREICDREIKGLLDADEIKKYRHKCLNHAKNSVRQLTNCRQPNCNGIFYVEPNAKSASCTICMEVTCIPCNTVHEDGKSCKDDQAELMQSKAYKDIEEQIKNKKLMRCPDCRTLIQRTKGCGWIQCTTCGTELCWFLQTYRWGPNGCKCLEKKKLCHPDCPGCIPDNNRLISTSNSNSNNGGSGYSQNNRPNFVIDYTNRTLEYLPNT